MSSFLLDHRKTGPNRWDFNPASLQKSELLKEKKLVLDASAFNQIIKTCLQLEDKHRKLQGKGGMETIPSRGRLVEFRWNLVNGCDDDRPDRPKDRPLRQKMAVMFFKNFLVGVHH